MIYDNLLCLCWWHPPPSPEVKGSQQSHVPTLCSWHVGPSGNVTPQTLEYTNTLLQRHCQTVVEACSYMSGNNFHSKLHYSCTGQMSQQMSSRLQHGIRVVFDQTTRRTSYEMLMVRHLGSGGVNHHHRDWRGKSPPRTWLYTPSIGDQRWQELQYTVTIQGFLQENWCRWNLVKGVQLVIAACTPLVVRWVFPPLTHLCQIKTIKN